MKKRDKKRIIEIELNVRQTINKYGLIIDDLGHIWRLPFYGSDGRLWRLKKIDVFNHIDYNAIYVNRKIVAISTILKHAEDVNFKGRYEIDYHTLPDGFKPTIIREIPTLNKSSYRKYLSI